jgi:hypothetical protein
MTNAAVTEGTIKSSELASFRQSGASTPTNPKTPPPPRHIYLKFIKAVTQAISYRLSATNQILPLGANRFALSQPEHWNGTAFESSGLQPLEYQVYLTSSGSLVVSVSPSKLPLLWPCSLGGTVDQDIVLAPGLIQARLASSDSAQILPFDSQESEVLREEILVRLSRKGLLGPAVHDRQAWAAIEIVDPNCLSSSGLRVESDQKVLIWWPLSLCLGLDETRALPVNPPQLQLIKPAESAAWFIDPDHGGFLDPLAEAETWFKGKSDRDKTLAERERQKIAQAKQKHQLATSPANSRPIIYGEGHAGAGVYPTPPDGLSSQIAHGLGGFDSIAPSQVDTQMIDTKDLFASTPVADTTKESQAVVDDLFGDMDMDDDDFGGSDVTDADFSFFDKPDDDVDMAESAPVTDIVPGLQIDVADDSDVKPTIGTSNSPQANDQSTALDVQDDSKSFSGGADDMATKSVQPDASQPSNEAQGMPLERLNPDEVRRRLYEEKDAKTGSKEKNIGAFAPLSFSGDLNTVDAKYGSFGPFGFKSSGSPSWTQSLTHRGSELLLPQKYLSQKPVIRQKMLAAKAEAETGASDSDDDTIVSEDLASSWGGSPTKEDVPDIQMDDESHPFYRFDLQDQSSVLLV